MQLFCYVVVSIVIIIISTIIIMLQMQSEIQKSYLLEVFVLVSGKRKQTVCKKMFTVANADG